MERETQLADSLVAAITGEKDNRDRAMMGSDGMERVPPLRLDIEDLEGIAARHRELGFQEGHARGHELGRRHGHMDASEQAHRALGASVQRLYGYLAAPGDIEGSRNTKAQILDAHLDYVGRVGEALGALMLLVNDRRLLP